MKKLILLTFLVSGSAFAQLDTSIYDNVGNYGPQKAYKMQNNYQPTYQPVYQAPIRQTDWTCMNGCTGAGMMYQFCQSKCSY